MRIEPRTYDLNGHRLVLRSGEKEDTAAMVPYLKRVYGETRYLLKGADECEDPTPEQEEAFILSYINNDLASLILAELDGEFTGILTFNPADVSRRNAHRAEINLALYLKYTGMGIGRKLFALALEAIRECGFESAELIVVQGNERAKKLYESFGFIETGRIPRANKYDDGTYADDIYMFKDLR